MSREVEEAMRELRRRARARESLHTYALSIDIPTVPFEAPMPDEELLGDAKDLMERHHSVMLAALQRCVTKPGGYGRLMMFLPPGSAKSLYSDVVMPTWYMAKFPGSRLILASYGDKIAERQSRRCHQIIEQQKYRDLWLDAPTLNRDAAGDWSLTNKSEMLAMSLTGGMTGNRACFKAGTRVYTTSGHIPIETVTRDTVVFGYDAEQREIRPCAVRGMRTLRKDSLVRVRTVAGREFVCTDDHPIFTGEGYTPAGLLEPGQPLVCTGDVLAVQRTCMAKLASLPSVLHARAKRAANAVLRWMRRTGSSADVRMGEAGKERNSKGVLLQKLPDQGVQCSQTQAETAEGAEITAQTSRYIVRHVQHDVQAVDKVHEVLRHEVQEPWAFSPDARTGQRALETRASGSVSAAVLCDAPVDSPQGQGLRGVPNDSKAGMSPHRRDANKQRTGKFGDVVQGASPPCAQQDRVAVVERLRESSELVYDIGVAETCNFFAEGILVHNSGLIIDDPIKGREQADSELERQTTLDAYMDDAQSRLLPGAWQVMTVTRWHERDLPGSILPDSYDGRSGVLRCKDGMDWEVLNIPAKCERNDDPLGRKPGEYLWTSFYGENHWKMYEEATGPESARRWSSLYQQRPSPQGAGRFNEAMFDFYDPDELPPPAQLTPVGAGDYAVTAGKNDFTELGVFGVDTRGDLWELDWWNKQCDTGESTEKTLDMIARWKIAMWFNEGGVIDKAMRPLFNRRQRERKVYCDFRSLPSMQDKVAKCSSFQGRAATGTVHFRNTANSRRIVGQLVALPAGRYDDAADVCGLIGRAIDQFHVPRLAVREERKIIKPFSVEWLESGDEAEEKKVRYR